MRKWFTSAPAAFWGDRLDVRFHLCRILRGFHGKRILDLGCGAGIILSEVPADNEKFGIELHAPYLDVAKKLNPNGTFVIGDIMKTLPFPDKFFDVVIAANIVELGTVGPGFLPEAHRVLRETGLLVLTTPNREHPTYHNHSSKFSFAQLSQILEPLFSGRIFGYNHLGFLPTFTRRLLYPLPFIGSLLAWLMVRFPPERGTAFYFQGTPRP